MNKIDFIKQKIREAGGSERFSLSDVLLAIEKRVTDIEQPLIAVGPAGAFIEVDVQSETWGFAREENNNKTVYWNLRADRLEDQSEETIEFLYNLLK